MKISKANLLKLLGNKGSRYVVPIYQRSYSWKTEQCAQLFDDLIGIKKSGRKPHFMGCLVRVYNPEAGSESKTEYFLIDGQQRLTSVYLLLLALARLLRRGLIKLREHANLNVFSEFLVDTADDAKPVDFTADDGGDTLIPRLQLKSAGGDQKVLQQLIVSSLTYSRSGTAVAAPAESSQGEPSSNLAVNFEYFYGRLQQQEMSGDELLQALSQLEFADIVLDSEDDPQLIFESLNATGLELDEGDKIRNFILMNDKLNQDRLYTRFWLKIEERTAGQVSLLVRDFLTLELGRIPKLDRVYVEFKRFVQGQPELSSLKLLEALASDASRWQILNGAESADAELNAVFERLNRLEVNVSRPFFLQLLRFRDEGALSTADVKQICRVIETYLLRRIICALPTNALNKVFLQLSAQLKDCMQKQINGTEYLERLKYLLLTKEGRGALPRDAEFEQQLRSRQLYQMNKAHCAYILERLNNQDSREAQSIYQKLDEGIYSIEHVMPQHLTDAWIEELGGDEEEACRIHQQWLHRLANLTLTAYNSEYSNRSFADKKNCECGFAKSLIGFNQWICAQPTWNETTLQKREDLLVEAALQLWPLPQSAYQPEEKAAEIRTLEDKGDDEAFTGTHLEAYSFKDGVRTAVKNWAAMYRQVVQRLCAETPGLIGRAKAAGGMAGNALADSSDELRAPSKLADGIFLEMNFSTNSRIKVLRQLFNLCGREPAELTFYLRVGRDSIEESAALNLRLRYWSALLQAVKDSGLSPEVKACFAGKAPMLKGGMSVSIGISGMEINLVVNRNSARAALYLGDRSAERNKAVFDDLYREKDVIEAELGRELVWLRGDGQKTSRISLELTGVNLKDEKDWPVMMDFQLQCSQRFYDSMARRILKKYKEQC